MTVKELIDELNKCDPEALIIMSSDGEGNSHTPLSGFWHGFYAAESTWSGEVYEAGERDCDEIDDETEEPARNDGVPAIILTPTN